MTIETSDYEWANDARTVALSNEVAATAEQLRAATGDNAALLVIAKKWKAVQDVDNDACDCRGEEACPRCLVTEVVADAHPGAALLTENDALRKQVETLTSERDEARKQAEQYATALMDAGEALGVRAVTASTVAAEARVLRDRAEHFSRQCATARDAALEEAKREAFQCSERWREAARTTSDAAEKRRHEARAGACTDVEVMICALKDQPARRFVEAERVETVLDSCFQECPASGHVVHYDRKARQRLGLRGPRSCTREQLKAVDP